MIPRRCPLWGLAAYSLLIAATACSSSGSSTDGGSPDDGRSATSSTLQRPSGQTPPGSAGEHQAHEIDTSFEYQSFVITAGHVTFDREAKRLSLGLRFENISGRWAQTETTSTLVLGDGTSIPMSGDVLQVPPGVDVEVTVVAAPVFEDPVEDGVVRWGSPEFDQPVFRLDGEGGENLWLPRSVPADGWTQIGKFGIHLTEVEVHASQIDLGIQSPPGTRVIRAFVEKYTARGTTSPFHAPSNLLLRLPSGEVVEASHGSPAASSLSWTAQGGQWADFVVPAPVDGRYELLLASMPKLAFGTIRPELVERRSVAFELDGIVPGPSPEDRPLSFLAHPPTPEGDGKAFDVELVIGSMNIPGFDFRPTRLTYTPATRSASLDAAVTSLVSSVLPRDGLLTAAPSFGFRAVLDTGGGLAVGVVRGDPALDHDKPTNLTFDFTDVRHLTPGSAGLYIGSGEGAVSSMPLGDDSNTVAWPPTSVAHLIDTPEIVAGDWTVQLLAYRIGLFDPDVRPTLGRRQLEVSFDVTAAPTARPNALGLSFRPATQILLAGGTGYDQAAVFDSGSPEMTPGETSRLTATFDVADTFGGGRTGFVVRSRSELDLLSHWIETRFVADLTGGAVDEEVFG